MSNKDFKSGVWENPHTKSKVYFVVDTVKEKRYTSCPYFGFDIGEPCLEGEEYNLISSRFELLLFSLSSTITYKGSIFYLVDDLLEAVYALDYKKYIENILRVFASSGVGIIPLIDEACGYKPWENKNSKKYINIFNEELLRRSLRNIPRNINSNYKVSVNPVDSDSPEFIC
jgi:hypothetical protein